MRRTLLGAFAAPLAGLLVGAGLSTPAAAQAPLRIMPLGDSITVGVGSPGRNGYRIDLQRRLRDAGLAVDFVGSHRDGTAGDGDHEGVGGWTIDQIAAQVDQRLAESAPDVVLLHAGTNNITRSEDPVAVAGKLSGLIDRVRLGAPRAHIYVAKIIGTSVASEEPANRAYNALIPSVVAAKDAMVHLVDQSTVAGLDIYDRHHPNEFGYRKMSYTWYQALRAAQYPELWSAGDPFRARQAYLCHARNQAVRDCRWWYLRKVSTAGGATTVERWQTRRWTTETFREWQPGRYEHRGRARTWVPGRYVTKKRQVAHWSSV
ncbi:hypothetical protein GCM10010112_01530 [Actinoplanes lobatus]|uniref:Lysophospholipase L1-like esterase n=1 Tax=Actinoplanes lobatus TaxID=113568 RepID=A0A7W7H9P5_9ACTN|nr:SGNH/GDSL hydrolase family protein [Actinoplanes lobatus]MBB4746574.1 lysophospholipase L1-like esterase [Actinoplanes lobatus]GGN53054.1 hypothetical protein GCM10010112_01530 [Actinoplanes lobatus]GIE38642.1 hypothetical protein Alo02nite_15400 [Actinoplanes lobatus]